MRNRAILTFLWCLLLSSLTFAAYKPSGKVLIADGGIAGDPQIIRSGDHYVMFFFEFVPVTHTLNTSYRVSRRLRGPWTDEHLLFNGYHKFRVLVDGSGAPVKIHGTFHGYAVSYPGTKEIFHFTAATLTGEWTNRGKVVPIGTHSAPDGLHTDAPGALYVQHKIFIYYMGHPAVSQQGFGLAMREMLSIADDPNGEYLKQGAVLDPSLVTGQWDFGYIGGAQVLMQNGKYVMYYNAGDTRPHAAGYEDASDRFGIAVASNPRGPWKTFSKPLADFVSGSIEKENIWRPYVIRVAGQNIVFYNTGVSGKELITYATF